MSRTLVKIFPALIPAGTSKSAPITVLTQFEPNTVKRIEWTFPHGCNGQVGIQIGARSVPVLPGDASQFYVTSGDTHGIDLEGMHETGDWSIIGYNTGKFDHTIQVHFLVHRIEKPPVYDMAWLESELSYQRPPFPES